MILIEIKNKTHYSYSTVQCFYNICIKSKLYNVFSEKQEKLYILVNVQEKNEEEKDESSINKNIY